MGLARPQARLGEGGSVTARSGHLRHRDSTLNPIASQLNRLGQATLQCFTQTSTGPCSAVEVNRPVQRLSASWILVAAVCPARIRRCHHDYPAQGPLQLFLGLVQKSITLTNPIFRPPDRVPCVLAGIVPGAAQRANSAAACHRSQAPSIGDC